MSAPETKARPPAPLTTMTRIASSRSKSSMMRATASHISSETALCRAGLLKIRRPIAAVFLGDHLAGHGLVEHGGFRSLLMAVSRRLWQKVRRFASAHSRRRSAAGDCQPADRRQLR